MKKSIKYILIGWLGWVSFSCSNNVPVDPVDEGNPVIEILGGISIEHNYVGAYLTIRNKGNGVLIWNILKCPEWLQIWTTTDTLLQQTESRVYMAMIFNSGSPLIDNPEGQIVIESNDKNHPVSIIPVRYDTGSPVSWCEPDELNFELTDTIEIIGIKGEGGILLWEFIECPEWIFLSQVKGSSGHNIIQVRCDRENLPDGETSGVIILKTSDKNHPIYTFPVNVAK